jgi:hypothetical protein
MKHRRTSHRIWNAAVTAFEGIVLGLAFIGFIYVTNVLLAWVDTL